MCPKGPTAGRTAMKEHLSIDEKLHTLRQVARDYVTHNFMKQDRMIELIGELEDDIKREVADAASDAAPIAPTADAQRSLKPAKVGGVRFGVGGKWSTVIGSAQRQFEYG